MLQQSRTPLLLGLVAGCCLTLAPQTGRSQGAAEKGAPARFTTADGVEIRGTFFAGKKNSPTVLMLHALGASEDSNKGGWQKLAQALNAKGYAVLTFDFRGHGNSTNIDPKEFWGGQKSGPINQQLVKGVGRDTIEFKDFSKAYYPILVNDIAAAKGFLDHKNDAGECDTSALVVIGADTGAALGAIWANSEFYRYKINMAQGFVPGQPFPIQQMKLDKDAEGKNTLACVWLSINPILGGYTLNLAHQLKTPAKTNAVPMAFLYGAKDATGERRAKTEEKSIKAGIKKGKLQFTVAVAIPGADDKLRGRGLLEVGGIDKAIAEYIDNVSAAQPPNWTEREFRKSGYVWRTTSFGQPQPAKFPGEQTMIFHDYRLAPFMMTGR